MPAKRSSNDDSANKRNLIQGMEKMNLLSKEISSMTAQMEQWIQALTNLSYAVKDQDLLHDVISTLSKMQPKPDRKKPKPTTSQQSPQLIKKPTTSQQSPQPIKKPTTSQQSPQPIKKPTTSQQSPQPENENNSSYKPHSPDGDSLFDLLNSPSLENIVKHVMEKKKKKG
jgi:outer membrane biosynthesis protein TonB